MSEANVSGQLAAMDEKWLQSVDGWELSILAPGDLIFLDWILDFCQK